MLWLQQHASTVLFSTFGISCLVMITCVGLYFYYVFVSFADGRKAHPKYITECSIMLFGFFGVANGTMIFRLIGQNPISFTVHAIIALVITFFMLFHVSLFFHVREWKLFYYTFPLPACVMIACFFAECIFALYQAICTPGSIRPLSQALHKGVHAFLGVTTLVIMFWNITLMLAMMCVNPKHQQHISEINYEDLLMEPAYMAMLLLFYMLLVLFILLVPFLKSKKSARHTEYDVQDIEGYSINKHATTEVRKTNAGRLEHDKEEGIREHEEDSSDADDELEEDNGTTARSNAMRKKTKAKMKRKGDAEGLSAKL